MENKKIMQEWIEKAEKVNSIELEQEDIREVDFEGFNDHLGAIYEFNGNLYSRSKKNPRMWLKTSLEQKHEEGKDESEVIKELIKQNQKLAQWCSDFKQHVDKTLKDLEFKQNEDLKDLKEYIDHRTKK